MLAKLEKLKHLKTLTLHNNPFPCNYCPTKNLVDFVKLNYEKLRDLKKVTCDGGNLLYKLSFNEDKCTSDLSDSSIKEEL